MREAQCRADSSTFPYTVKQALESEITRMRMLGATTERIAAFREAAEVHIALCNASGIPDGGITLTGCPIQPTRRTAERST
jgi:hypothetical protein